MRERRRAVFVRPRLEISGADRWTVDAATALQESGWEAEVAVNFFNPAWTQPEVASGRVKVTALGGLPARLAAGRMRVVLALVNHWILLRRLRGRSAAPDLFVSDILPHAVPAIRRWFPQSAALVYCHFPDRLAVEAHGAYALYRAWVGRFEDRGMQAAHRVVANSNYTASAIRQAFPFLSGERLAVVHPGVPRVRVPACGGSSSAGAPTQRTWLVVARFDPSKGLPLAIEAFVELRARMAAAEFSRHRLVLAGGCDRRLPEVRRLVEQLRALAAARGVADQVQMQFNPTADELEVRWREAAALIHCAPAEHFGIVLIEAMARGLPVLAVNFGGPMEIVVDGVTGALRAPRAGDFADVLVNWARDPAQAAALGAAGRARAESEFSLAQFSARFAAQADLTVRRGEPSGAGPKIAPRDGANPA